MTNHFSKLKYFTESNQSQHDRIEGEFKARIEKNF